ncbi:hypothetical protein NQ318_000099 [Aromia moschata]|uniref:Tetraspanin n=1 Tax=Aromia moschata TaxID=1265417 RepID=A0AAV8XFU2_9CUCU|nr:hypothetical protein NQ318_000099 [Aromia moschata]
MVGFLLISIGSTVKAIYSDFEEFMADHYYSASNLAIAIGISYFFVALFGCIGAIKESVCLVNTCAMANNNNSHSFPAQIPERDLRGYSSDTLFSLLCILVLEISVSIAAYVMRGNVEETIERNMRQSMNEYNNIYTQYTWNATQYNLRCCGVDGPTDWNEFAEEYNLTFVLGNDNETEYYIPETCCTNENCESEENIYQFGCVNRITYIVSECALLLAVGALCVSFIQLLGVTFSHLLARSIRRLKTQIVVARMERRQHIYEQLAKSGNNEKVAPVLYTPTSSEA